MQLIPRNLIEIGPRQRAEDSVTVTSVAEMKQSILQRGLFHPPVVAQHEDKYILVIGRRRLFALDQIAKEDKKIICNNVEVEPGQIPVTLLADYLDEVGRFEAELDENLHREDLNWQDRTRALAALHDLRWQQDPRQTLTDTANELVEKNKLPKTESQSRAVSDAVLVAKNLHDPKIAGARNQHEARALILKREEERFHAELTKRALKTSSDKPSIVLRHGDLHAILPVLEESTYDLICTDPPYGIDANVGGFRARTVHHHNYDDSADNARRILQLLLSEGFRITKPRANLFIFTDIDHFFWLRTAASAAGWTPFRTPLIWQKSESEGLAPWGSAGPRRTYDIIFYASKGANGGLISSPVDIFNVKRVARDERTFAAEKPVELMQKLIECSTLPGDTVIDPCCGSGATLVAAKRCGRKGLGIELDETTYNTAMTNVYS